MLLLPLTNPPLAYFFNGCIFVGSGGAKSGPPTISPILITEPSGIIFGSSALLAVCSSPSDIGSEGKLERSTSNSRLILSNCLSTSFKFFSISFFFGCVRKLTKLITPFIPFPIALNTKERPLNIHLLFLKKLKTADIICGNLLTITPVAIIVKNSNNLSKILLNGVFALDAILLKTPVIPFNGLSSFLSL